MPNAPIILAIDCTANDKSKSLVQSNGSLLKFDKLIRGVYPVIIFPRQFDPNAVPGLSTPILFDVVAAGYDGIRFGIWSKNPGTDVPYSDPSTGTLLTLTDQTRFTYNTDDPLNPYFTGQINTNTDQITTWLNGACDGDAYLGISLVKGADLTPIYQAQCGTPNITIDVSLDPGSGNSVDMTGAVARLPLPWHLGPDADGNTWVCNVVAGQFQLTLLNP